MLDEPGVAWVSLDGHDGEPSSFWTQVRRAVTDSGTGTAGFSDPHPVVPGDPDSDPVAFLPALVDWLSDSSCRWLVLDDVDTVAHGALLPGLAYLIANLPPAMRLAVTTHDAPRRLPADPADRRLVTIDRDQLRAWPDEAIDIALASAPMLDVEGAEGLAHTADGWVAAIRLAARHAAQHLDANAAHWLATTGAPALLGPWLDRLAPDAQRFLVDTLALDMLSGPLCDAVLDTVGSVQVLDELEARGGYLDYALPPGPGTAPPTRWWARHPLVTAALHSRAPLVDQSERNMRAYRWYDENGFFDPGMRHLIAAGQLEEAGRYLSLHENSLIERGRGDTVASWYAALPPDTWGQLGWHLLRQGWGLAITKQRPEAVTSLARLRAHLATSTVDGIEQRVLEAEAATFAAYLSSMTGDTTSAVAFSRRAIELFCEESPDNSQQLAPVLLVRGLLWEGDVAGARRELTRIAYQPFGTDVIRESLLGGQQAQCLTDEGRIRQAQVHIRSANRWLTSQRLSALGLAQFSLMTADGTTTLESGDVSGGRLKLLEVVAAAVDHGANGDAAIACVWLARAHVAAGHLTDALASLAEGRRLLLESAPSSRILHRLDLTEALVRHIGGDIVRAERLVQGVPVSDARTLTWARVTMHRQASGVRRALTSLASDSPRVSVEKQILLAMVAMRRNDALAEGHLVRAADIAAAHGLQLAFLGCPGELLELAHAVATRTSHDDLRALVEAVSPPGPPAGDRATTRAGSTATPLSPGELELLAYLPRRDTNADIARQLGVSVNTIKTRLYRLYRKMGVDSRDACIRAARARGLLS